jgi:predicted dehydrogenase
MLGLGIVGCGRVTTMFHLKAIGEVDGLEVVAVADPDSSRVADVGKKAGAERHYIDYRELLSDPNVDAVAVNTPPRLHEVMVLDTLRAGKHVLCEKPLARSAEGCMHIREVQEAVGLTVTPVHNYAFTPCLETARKVIGRGEIGGLRRASLRFDNNLRSYGSRTPFRMEERFSIVEDILPHVLSVVHEVATGPVEVEEVRGWSKSYKVIDNLSIGLRALGVESDCSMNWTSLIPGFTVEMVGDAGRITMDLMKRPYRVSIEAGGRRRTMDKPGLGKYIDLIRIKHPAFTNQYIHFVGVVEGEEEPRFTVDDEIKMLRVMDDVVGMLSETPISQT